MSDGIDFNQFFDQLKSEAKSPATPKFQFGNVVVVDGDNIGLIVKSWQVKTGFSHDVYVRYFDQIKNYHEDQIKHFVYSKELSEEEKDFY